MKKILITLLIFSIVVSNAKADNSSPIVTTNSNDVRFIQKGTEAPFDGYLFPPEKAINLKQELMELDEYKKLAESYQRSIDNDKKNDDLYNFKINTLLDQNDKLANAMYKQKDRDVWENRLWFAFGVFITGSAVFLATKLK